MTHSGKSAAPPRFEPIVIDGRIIGHGAQLSARRLDEMSAAWPALKRRAPSRQVRRRQQLLAAKQADQQRRAEIRARGRKASGGS